MYLLREFYFMESKKLKNWNIHPQQNQQQLNFCLLSFNGIVNTKECEKQYFYVKEKWNFC